MPIDVRALMPKYGHPPKCVRSSGMKPIMAVMAYDAMSPFGISWGYLALLLLLLLLAAMVALAVVRRRDATPRLLLLLLAAAVAGSWTFFTVGASVIVPIPQDPQGAECLVDPIGDNPGRVVSWHSDCGQALAKHMAISAGPTLVMLGATITAIAHGVRRRHGTVPVH